MIAFIDDHRQAHGVEQICKVFVRRTPASVLDASEQGLHDRRAA
jgi:hypothetical protein